jgi:TolB protein
MDRKFMLYCALVFLIGLGSIFSAQAEKFNLEVYASNLDSISIAILPMKNVGTGAITKNEPWNVLASDLGFCGKINVFPMLKADTAELSRNNVPLYIDGEYEVFGKFVRVGFTLRDSKSSDALAEKKYEGELVQTRAMAHRFADLLVETLFNNKGIFQSRNIMVMDWDGENMRQLTANPAVNIFPVFMDSSAFLWTSFIRGHPDIYKGVIGGKGGVLIPSRFIESSPSYSPITGKIAFCSSRDGNMEIYTCDGDGTNIKRITTSRAIETSPCWSPNGYQIAFTSDRIGSPRIFVMDADGSNVRRLTFEGGYQDSPAWSPKGDKIAYQCITDGKFDIWTVHVDGSNLFQVTRCPGNNEYPGWAADGEHLVFSSTRGGSVDLYGILSDGRRMVRLTNTGNAKMPDWGNF